LKFAAARAVALFACPARTAASQRGFMKYRRICSLLFLLLAINVLSVSAQQTKPKRPVKNPPQYPNIIDVENKDALPAKQPNPQTGEPAAPAPPDALTQAMTSLTVELRNLSQELKALNVRQQMSIDLLRQSRLDQRIDRYENDLRPVRERIAALEIEEQKLHQLMTRESLIAQTAQTSTVNREATMQQFKGQLAVRLQAVLDEKERLRKVETDQGASLDIYQKLNIEAEQKIQQAEEKLRELEKIKPNGPNGPEIKQ
jgi:hypothetical protein